ncbi:hypothetical protein TNCV_1828271 [Trichonephila clavipes]|nr:hypothetical protein TNCV_1828271 [Trichonephila clavipes]
MFPNVYIKQKGFWRQRNFEPKRRPELAPPSPNYHTTPTGGAPRYTASLPYTAGLFSGTGKILHDPKNKNIAISYCGKRTKEKKKFRPANIPYNISSSSNRRIFLTKKERTCTASFQEKLRMMCALPNMVSIYSSRNVTERDKKRGPATCVQNVKSPCALQHASHPLVLYLKVCSFASFIHTSLLGFGWKRVAINSGPKNPKDLLKKRRVRHHTHQEIRVLFWSRNLYADNIEKTSRTVIWAHGTVPVMDMTSLSIESII